MAREQALLLLRTFSRLALQSIYPYVMGLPSAFAVGLRLFMNT